MDRFHQERGRAAVLVPPTFKYPQKQKRFGPPRFRLLFPVPQGSSHQVLRSGSPGTGVQRGQTRNQIAFDASGFFLYDFSQGRQGLRRVVFS